MKTYKEVNATPAVLRGRFLFGHRGSSVVLRGIQRGKPFAARMEGLSGSTAHNSWPGCGIPKRPTGSFNTQLMLLAPIVKRPVVLSIEEMKP